MRFSQVRLGSRLCENSDFELSCRNSFSITMDWKRTALPVITERRKVRKQFCAFSARARFYTAWVIRVDSDISARGPVTPQFRTWIAWRRSPRRTSHGLLRRSPHPTSSQGRSAVIHCGSDASVSCLNSTGNVAFGVFHGPELCPVDCAKRPRSEFLSRHQQLRKLRLGI